MFNLARKIYKTSNFLIIWSLVVSPLGYANNKTSAKESAWSVTANVVSQFAQITGSATNAYLQGLGNNTQAVDQFKNQLSSTLQLQPVDQSQLPPVFNGCIVFPAAANKLSTGMMCSEVLKSEPNKIRDGYAAALIEISEFNKIQLENFTIKGHERMTSQGVGCYEKKITDFETLLDIRNQELEKFKESLKKRIEAFKLASKNDLEGIKQANAFLKGTPEKYLKDFKFEDQFLGSIKDPNNICASVISATDLNRAGSGGFEEIEKQLFTKMNDKSSGRFTADEILQKKSQMTKEISNIASAIAKKVSRRDDLKADGAALSFNTKFFNTGSGPLKDALNKYNNQVEEELGTLKKELNITQIMGSDPTAAKLLSGIDQGNINLEQRITDYENNHKKQCFNNLISKNFGSITNLVQRFENPNVSKTKNRNADNAFKNYIVSTFNDSDDINQMITNIVAQEKKGINKNLIIRTGKSFTIDGMSVNASTPLRPSQLLSVFTSNCIKRFEREKNSDGYTPRQIVKNLKTYNSKIKQIRRNAPTNVTAQIINQLNNCPTDNSTGSTALSCSGALNPTSNNFCLRTAEKCASNFKACHNKTNEIIKSTKATQQNLANNYNAAVAQMKVGIKQELAAINKFMEAQARSLDAQLNLGTVFNVPSLEFDLSKEYPFEGKNAQGIDPALALEDPEKFLEMANTQIAKLQKELNKQKTDQIAKLNNLKNDYIKRYKTQARTWEQVMANCQQSIGEYDKMIQNKNQETAENQDLIDKACGDLLAFSASPGSGDVTELMGSLQKATQLAAAASPQQASAMAANDKMALQKIASANGKCDVKTGDSGIIMPGASNSMSVSEFCSEENSKVHDLFGSAKVKSLCSIAQKPVCDDQTVQENLTTLFGNAENVCKTKGSWGALSEQASTSCKEENIKRVDEIKLSDLNPKQKKSINCSKVSKEDKNQAQEYIESMIAGYNCHKVTKSLGQVKVSACNTFGSSVTQKSNSYMDALDIIAQGAAKASAIKD